MQYRKQYKAACIYNGKNTEQQINAHQQS